MKKINIAILILNSFLMMSAYASPAACLIGNMKSVENVQFMKNHHVTFGIESVSGVTDGYAFIAHDMRNNPIAIKGSAGALHATALSNRLGKIAGGCYCTHVITEVNKISGICGKW